MTTGVAGIREKNFHSKKRMETAQKVSVIQSYFLLAPYLKLLAVLSPPAKNLLFPPMD